MVSVFYVVNSGDVMINEGDLMHIKEWSESKGMIRERLDRALKNKEKINLGVVNFAKRGGILYISYIDNETWEAIWEDKKRANPGVNEPPKFELLEKLKFKVSTSDVKVIIDDFLYNPHLIGVHAILLHEICRR